MKQEQKEVRELTDKQLLAYLEALKIIAEQMKSAEEVKNALDRIQGVMKTSTKSGKTK